ncbi:MAG: hypothetical protein KF713_03405 [Turneriella sp.]|nr:hypothetical protein [Turneriella sp.]
MKRILPLFLGAVTALSALEPGKNYDFFQKNGQNVLGAELIAENETEYTVRLKYVPKPIKITRANLTEIPLLSRTQPPAREPALQIRRDVVLNTSLGFAYMTIGGLSGIFRTGFEARIGADWLLFEKPFYRLRALSVLSTFSRYQSSTRRIQLISGYAGPKFLLWRFETIDAAFFASTLAGISYADLRGYTFTSSYATFAAMGLLSFEKRWKSIAFAAQLYVNSLFDSTLNFESTGVSVAAQYPLGGAAPF